MYNTPALNKNSVCLKNIQPAEEYIRSESRISEKTGNSVVIHLQSGVNVYYPNNSYSSFYLHPIKILPGWLLTFVQS